MKRISSWSWLSILLVSLTAAAFVTSALLAQTAVDSNFHHSLVSATATTTTSTSGSPFNFPSMDAIDTPRCTASSNVLTNTATAGTNWTMKVQGSADNTTFYDIDLDTAATVTTSVVALASGTGPAAALSFTSGFRYVRVVGYWGTAPSGGGTSTCTATIACKR